MQPEPVSLWLRPETSSKGEQPAEQPSIQRSAWKRNSPKFTCRILHRTVHFGAEDGLFPARVSEGNHKMLGVRISMRVLVLF